VDFFQTLAGQAAISVHNARLYEMQHVAFSQLAEKVDELTQAQARLIESERLKAMGQMAAGVAHDFNNALVGILGQTQLLRLSLEQGPVAAALRDVKEGTRLLEYLTRQELAVEDAAETVRKIRGATRPRDTEAFEPVALGEIVEQALAITQPRWKNQAEAAGVQMTIQTALAETPPVLGHAAELREALTNLIFNALDAMPQGGTLTITTRSAGEWVELSVTDSGIGMSPAVQARLFEPFFTTKGVRGTGLGLSMVHGIVSRHQGTISVQSTEAQGTTITMRLPVAQVAAAEVEPLSSEAPPPLAVTSLKLLVIDDEPILAQTLGDLLRFMGHETVLATSGEEGLARLAAEPVDMVLTDLGMPTMSGWQVAQAVKTRWPQLPVILVTGWGDTLGNEQLNGTGVDLVLAKPYTIELLRDALATAIARTALPEGSLRAELTGTSNG
jgi:signal transduction histidine kinase/ActR/RegA family two-component response regulator